MAAADSNWLHNIQGKSFADISFPEAAAAELGSVPINTQEFLRAAESLVTLFDILGSYKFKAVIEDLNGNIAKVKARMLAAPAESETLQDLVRNELKSGKHVATEGLLWLGRGLDFTVQSLRHNLDNPSSELNQSFTTAYGATLSNYHGWIVRKGFNLALGFCPKRVIFYRQLADKNYKEGQNADQEKALDEQVQAEVIPDLEKEIQALEKVVKILQAFQATPEASSWQKK